MDPRQHADQLRRTFVPPSELDSSRPREVSLTAGGRALFAVAILLFAGALTVGVVLERRVAHEAEARRANVVASALPGALPPWLPVFVVASIGSAGLLCLLLLNSQRRLLMDGRPAPAVVTAHVKLQSPHGGAHRSIRYAFPLLSGAMETGKSDATRKAPEVGSVICVIYDPDRPKRSMPYPFPLVRPARLAIRTM